MTWAGLVWKNLMRRRVRTLLTVAGVSIGVGLIVALLSITAGVKNTAKDLIHVGRADFGVFQRNVSDLTRSFLPESLGERLDRVDGVTATSRIFLYVTTVQKQESVLVFGLVPSEFAEQRVVITSGARAIGTQAMVGDGAVGLLRVAPGGTLTVAGRKFVVVGVYHTGNRFMDNGVILPLAVVQQMAERPGEVTTFGVQVALGQRPAVVARRVERAFPGAAAVTEPGQAVKVDTSSRLIVSAGWVLSLLALIVGGIGVTNTMAMSVFERMREIGILRAVGWRRWRIALLIVSEAVGICLLALCLGLGLGALAAELFTSRSSLSTLVAPDMTAGVFAWGLAFALGVGLIGAVYPTWLAVRLTPIQALRHE